MLCGVVVNFQPLLQCSKILSIPELGTTMKCTSLQCCFVVQEIFGNGLVEDKDVFVENLSRYTDSFLYVHQSLALHVLK
jgi:hypothetical protein